MPKSRPPRRPAAYGQSFRLMFTNLCKIFYYPRNLTKINFIYKTHLRRDCTKQNERALTGSRQSADVTSKLRCSGFVSFVRIVQNMILSRLRTLNCFEILRDITTGSISPVAVLELVGCVECCGTWDFD